MKMHAWRRSMKLQSNCEDKWGKKPRLVLRLSIYYSIMTASREKLLVSAFNLVIIVFFFFRVVGRDHKVISAMVIEDMI
jgi:hypothetical protein